MFVSLELARENLSFRTFDGLALITCKLLLVLNSGRLPKIIVYDLSTYDIPDFFPSGTEFIVISMIFKCYTILEMFRLESSKCNCLLSKCVSTKKCLSNCCYEMFPLASCLSCFSTNICSSKEKKIFVKYINCTLR